NLQGIMIAAEEWLADCGHLPLHLKLRFSDQYNLYTLKSECLRQMREMNIWGVTRVTKSDSYKYYSNELKKELDLIESESLEVSPSKKRSRLDGTNLQTNDGASDVIRMRVENVKNLSKDGVRSEVKRINGFPW
ncbi:hypothetical protein PENTCL1PPCAC_23545, partial [Pristionchus entomophagus]